MHLSRHYWCVSETYALVKPTDGTSIDIRGSELSHTSSARAKIKYPTDIDIKGGNEDVDQISSNGGTLLYRAVILCE